MFLHVYTREESLATCVQHGSFLFLSLYYIKFCCCAHILYRYKSSTQGGRVNKESYEPKVTDSSYKSTCLAIFLLLLTRYSQIRKWNGSGWARRDLLVTLEGKIVLRICLSLTGKGFIVGFLFCFVLFSSFYINRLIFRKFTSFITNKWKNKNKISLFPYLLDHHLISLFGKRKRIKFVTKTNKTVVSLVIYVQTPFELGVFPTLKMTREKDPPHKFLNIRKI